VTTVADVARRLKPAAGPPRLPPILLMTDARRLADPLPAVARLPHGAGVVLRHYDAPNREELARQLLRICCRKGLYLLVGADARLAAATGAHGLHLPEHMVLCGRRTWKAWRRPDWIVTAAAHGPTTARRAAAAGADAVLVSPVFPTASHPAAAAIGPVRLARWVRFSPCPVYALGGIDGDRAQRVADTGVMGFAGISALS